MRKKTINILVLMIVILIICGLKNISIYAFQEKNNNIQIMDDKVIKEYITESALEWAKIMQPDIYLKVSKIRKIKTKENAAEYIVTFKCKKENYGYAILKNELCDFVVNEGVIQKGHKDLYEKIIEKVKNKNLTEIDKCLVKFSDRQYGVVCKEKNDKIFYDIGGRKMYLDEKVYTESYKTEQAIFISKQNWTVKKYKVLESIQLKKYLKRSKLFLSTQTARLTGKYACSVQALLQIAYMEGICDGSGKSIKSVYNSLWEKCKTKIVKKENGIILGKNYIEDSVRGFVNYAKSLGYNTVYKGVQKNPSMSWIKDKLKYNRPIIMSYTIYIGDKNEKPQKFSHTISVLGWMKAVKLSSKNTYNYLIVYDGWNDEHKYLNYTTVDFSEYCCASYFWLK